MQFSVIPCHQRAFLHSSDTVGCTLCSAYLYNLAYEALIVTTKSDAYTIAVIICRL